MHARHVGTALAALLLPVGLGAAPVTAAAEPPAPDRTTGTWSVTLTGAGAWRVAWTAPEPLVIGGDQPRILTSGDSALAPAGTDLGTTSLADDGRTVAVTVTTAARPRPDDLDVVLSGRTLDEPTPSGSAPGSVRFSEPEQSLLPADPGAQGDVPFVSHDYTLDPIQVDGMATPVEMVGHVVEPAPSAAEADDPLVLILHGRHWSCFEGTDLPTYTWPCTGGQQPLPNHLGYRYLQKTLASQGFVTVSISANAISAQDDLPDYGAAARAELVEAHLDQWAEWAGGQETVDMQNVVLVGHSRGGEGVALASLEIPIDAPYRITGQVLLAPTDFARLTTPYVPTVTVLPYCDGDVSDLRGQSFTDRSRDLVTDDTAMKSSVLVMGANHNFFNTEWTPGLSEAFSMDDWYETSAGACAPTDEARLTPGEQRNVGKAYVAGAVQLFADDAQQFLPMYDGTATHVPATGDAVVLSHLLGGSRTVVRPGLDGQPSEGAPDDDTASVSLCAGITPREDTGDTCGHFAHDPLLTPHWPATDQPVPHVPALQVQWSGAGQAGGLELDAPLDLTGADALDLRTVVDPRVGDVELAVRVTDGTGATAEVAPVGGSTLPALPRRSKRSAGRYWAQTLRVDPAALTGVDTSDLTAIELVGLSDAGRVWLLDASTVPGGLPQVPEKRIPFLDVGSVRVDEGPAGTHVAEVPFHVVGTLTSDAQVRVWRDSIDAPVGNGRLVTVPAGTTDGTFSWEYTGNDRDSVTPRVERLVVHGVRGVLTRDRFGQVTIDDDDPSPKLRFSTGKTSVAEGGTSTWVVRLEEPSKRGVEVGLKAVAGDGSPVRVDDMARQWLEAFVFVKPGTNPYLHEAPMRVSDVVDTKHPTAVFEVPIRDDDRKEGAETLTFRAVTNTGWRSRPVTVTIPAGR